MYLFRGFAGAAQTIERALPLAKPRSARGSAAAERATRSPVLPFSPFPLLPSILQRAAGHAELVEDLELAPGAAGVVDAGEDAGVAGDQRGHVFGAFAEQLDAVVADAGVFHARD